MEVFIIGAGGHAKVLLDCLSLDKNIQIRGILDINKSLHGKSILNIPILGDENDLLKKYAPSDIKLINGVGSVGLPNIRERLFNQFKKAGYSFLSVIHPTAYIGQEVVLGEGVQIMAGCNIQPGSYLGNNVIVNTHAAIDHDCYIDDHTHIAPGVVCCGNISIGKRTHVGCGAVIVQGMKIGEDCLIAAGAVVTRAVNSHNKVAGLPAKIME